MRVCAEYDNDEIRYIFLVEMRRHVFDKNSTLKIHAPMVGCLLLTLLLPLLLTLILFGRHMCWCMLKNCSSGENYPHT
jgi:hypothetical protein